MKAREKEELSGAKQWKYRKVINQIISALEDATILFNMKTGSNGNYDLEPLHFSEQWEINFSRGKHEKTKGPVDVLGEIEKINIFTVQQELFKTIAEDSTIEDGDKIHFQQSIENFISNNFLKKRNTLENKDKGRIHSHFRRLYTQQAAQKENLSQKEKIIYRDICLTLANMLYNKNPAFLEKSTGEINAQGLQHLASIFSKTIKNIPNSASSKAFHKIFHDGDFNFLRKEDHKGNPRPGTLNLYVKAIMYLMDAHSFNAYAEDAEDGAKEWAKSKKSFLNNLFASSYLEEGNSEKKEGEKEGIHNDLAEIWKDNKTNNNPERISTERFKTEASKMLKIGGRTKKILDESGLRLTYHGEALPSQEIEHHIETTLINYFKKVLEKNIKIISIQSDRKGNFVSSQGEENILKHLGTILEPEQEEEINISKRTKSTKNPSKLENLISKYQELTKKKPSLGIQQAYKIANGEVSRGANGSYEDFKVLVEYEVNFPADEQQKPEKDISLFQEISFYPQNNELNIGRHDILDLEKKIFNRVKNMNDSELGKTISLNRLRYFTETTLKDITIDIEIYEDAIRRGLLPKPKDDAYACLEIGDQKVSWKDLNPRTEKNTNRMDTLICMILNYFIKQNKLLYINKDQASYFGLITPQLLHDEKTYKLRRFTTPDVLKHTALDHKNSGCSICFYTEKSTYTYPNFYNVNLGDLGDFISLENQLKKH